MPSSKREQLVDTALALFCRHGFHATGIDRIIAEAGIAKMTLYKHFRSKDELILAAMRRHDESFRNWFMRRVESLASAPRARLLAVFDVLEEWFAEDDFTGCMFINAAAEYGGHEDPIHAAAGEHKRLIGVYLADLARAANFEDAEGLARQLMLLMEGAITMAYVVGAEQAAGDAKAAAASLLAAVD